MLDSSEQITSSRSLSCLKPNTKKLQAARILHENKLKNDHFQAIIMAPVPPFLFRAASHESRGLNTAEKIDPLDGYESKYHKDLASISLPDVRMMIYSHINWSYEAPSESSSWSVSLLYVLVHAARKRNLGEEDILVYVLDTSKLPASNDIHSPVDLVEDENLDMKCWEHLKVYAEGEYLIHGKLLQSPGLWRAVNLDRLIGNGLEKYCQGLFLKCDNPKSELLLQRVKQLRYRFFTDLYPLPDWVLPGSKRLAACFGSEWESVMTFALFALRRRNLSADGDCMTALVLELQSGGLKLPPLSWASSEDVRLMKFKWHRMVECRQFIQLLQLLDDRRAGNKEVKPRFHDGAYRVGASNSVSLSCGYQK